MPSLRGSVGAVGSVTRKLVNADAGGVLRMLVDSLEDMGRDALINLVGGGASPIGIALNAGLRYIDLESKNYAKMRGGEQREQDKQDKPKSAAQKRRDAQRHQEWLRDNSWRFDWRSQPRRPAGTEAGGEWMDGRLDYPTGTKKPFSRSVVRRRTRSMREYKARQVSAGNMKTRTIRSAWGDY